MEEEGFLPTTGTNLTLGLVLYMRACALGEANQLEACEKVCLEALKVCKAGADKGGTTHDEDALLFFGEPSVVVRAHHS